MVTSRTRWGTDLVSDGRQSINQLLQALVSLAHLHEGHTIIWIKFSWQEVVFPAAGGEEKVLWERTCEQWSPSGKLRSQPARCPPSPPPRTDCTAQSSSGPGGAEDKHRRKSKTGLFSSFWSVTVELWCSEIRTAENRDVSPHKNQESHAHTGTPRYVRASERNRNPENRCFSVQALVLGFETKEMGQHVSLTAGSLKNDSTGHE